MADEGGGDYYGGRGLTVHRYDIHPVTLHEGGPVPQSGTNLDPSPAAANFTKRSERGGGRRGVGVEMTWPHPTAVSPALH